MSITQSLGKRAFSDSLLYRNSIKVAEYITELPKRELLDQKKIHKAVELAREGLEAKSGE